MEIRDFVEAAKEYESLGWSVAGQLDDLLEGTYEPSSLNENAVTIIARFADTLYNYHGIDTNEIHSAIDDYESLEHEDEE